MNEEVTVLMKNTGEMMAHDAEYIMYLELELERLKSELRESKEYSIKLLQWWAREKPTPPVDLEEEP